LDESVIHGEIGRNVRFCYSLVGIHTVIYIEDSSEYIIQTKMDI